MHCPMCGNFFTDSPCFYPGTNTIVCPDCYPFECAGCHTTQKQSWIHDKDKDWCFSCYNQHCIQEDQAFEAPAEKGPSTWDEMMLACYPCLKQGHCLKAPLPGLCRFCEKYPQLVMCSVKACRFEDDTDGTLFEA